MTNVNSGFDTSHEVSNLMEYIYVPVPDGLVVCKWFDVLPGLCPNKTC